MDALASRVSDHLEALCRYADRHVGGPGNRAATEHFARVARGLGLQVDVSEFDCVDWWHGETVLSTGAEQFDVHAGPYTNPVDAVARLSSAATIEELEAGTFEGDILLLHGALCREQLTPKAYPFYELPGHQRIVQALEARRPAAILAATGRNPELAGSLYPFPLIEDAAVDLPNAYLTDVEGERLLAHAGETVSLNIDSGRIAARAEHVVARVLGRGVSRIVVFGHIDSKEGAPGALDNATGAAALLGLADLLAGDGGRHTVELVPVNGEDYYAATGERIFVADNAGRWETIVLGLNADGAGWAGHATEVSLYGCEGDIERAVRRAVVRRPGIVEGGPWYQSDHSLLVGVGRPAVAVTSEGFAELCATVTHTAADRLDLVDPVKVAEVARFYADVIAEL